MNKIDARKLNCPQPLILTKNALEGDLDEVLVLVDNDTAKQNILKFCNKMGYSAVVSDQNGDIGINIIKTIADTCDMSEEVIVGEIEKQNRGNKGYLIGTNILGNSSEELGKMLMKGFIYTLTQVKPYPEFIIFLNSGVKLASEGSDSIDDINQLLQHGTKIVSCGTCLDFYQLKDKLRVGEVTNMYDIVETISDSGNVITIG